MAFNTDFLFGPLADSLSPDQKQTALRNGMLQLGLNMLGGATGPAGGPRPTFGQVTAGAAPAFMNSTRQSVQDALLMEEIRKRRERDAKFKALVGAPGIEAQGEGIEAVPAQPGTGYLGGETGTGEFLKQSIGLSGNPAQAAGLVIAAQKAGAKSTAPTVSTVETMQGADGKPLKVEVKRYASGPLQGQVAGYENVGFSPQVYIDQKAPGAQERTIGEEAGKRYSQVQSKALGADDTISNFQLVLDNLDQSLAGDENFIKRTWSDFLVKSSFADKDTLSGMTATGIVDLGKSKLKVNARQALAGQGQISDKETELLGDSLIQGNTKASIEQSARVGMLAAEYDKKKAEFFANERQKGLIDKGKAPDVEVIEARWNKYFKEVIRPLRERDMQQIHDDLMRKYFGEGVEVPKGWSVKVK